jgi:lysozyme family protein
MPTISLTPRLAEEYRHLFDTCLISAGRIVEVEDILARIERNKRRYEAVAGALSMPWQVIALIHSLESSLSFTRHLHNGDSLVARTVHAPAGRPKSGSPPFSWEESAIDALKYQKMDQWQDWSLPGLLYKLEEYNGWGYRLYHPQVFSPYLWSGSNHYKQGKYLADGAWSETAVSRQIGAAVLLKRLAEKGIIRFSGLPAADPAIPADPLLVYSMKEWSAYAEELQNFLNKLPGTYVKVDGFAGDKTSEAFRQVTGHYLKGDPRAQA